MEKRAAVGERNNLDALVQSKVSAFPQKPGRVVVQEAKDQNFFQYGSFESNRWYITSTETACSYHAKRGKPHSSCSKTTTSLEPIGSQYNLILPDQFGSSAYRWLRWNFFSPYRRLFTIIFLVNVSALITISLRTGLDKQDSIRSHAITAACVNLTVSIVFRNEHVVNVLFLFSTSLPLSTPLLIRRWFAKIYAYGGIHSGCATAAVVWYMLFTGITAYHIWAPPLVDASIAAISLLTSFLLLLISAFAVSKLRKHLHDWFECVHRFAGWTAIILFWSLTVLTATKSSLPTSKALAQSASFWCLFISTLCVAYPWTRLRSQPCVAECLSDHAVRVHFEHRNVPHCSAVRLALNPLKDTHAFAAIPNHSSDRKGFSVIISKAGDWTSKVISHNPQKLFIRGGPFIGVLRVAVMFKPVLIVATGSGIGPCLSLFHGVPNLDCRVLWSASSPVTTYGEAIIKDVYQADPRAVIVDTSRAGRPVMEHLAYSIWKTQGCEAVIVISNPNLTRRLVYELETRGVPAYGPIFDS